MCKNTHVVFIIEDSCLLIAKYKKYYLGY